MSAAEASKDVLCTNCGRELSSDGQCRVCLLQLGRFADHAVDARFESTREHIGMQRRNYPGKQRSQPEILSATEMAERFPQYEIMNLIGQGGMGTVYRARQKSLDRVVAIKVIEENDRDPAFAERFSREARALAKLSHPNIVTVHDFGHSEHLFFLVMEYIDGVNLRQAIHANAFDPNDALRIIEQVCKALQYAHGRGVVHRDIKPENILLTEDGTVKIADFGLAKILDDGKEDVTLTATRQVIGTVAYMAPEQIDNSTQVDHRADIYSLGVVFYELLTGHLPLGRFELPSQRNACVDGRIDPVVMRTLSRAPGERYQSASDLASEISQFHHTSEQISHHEHDQTANQPEVQKQRTTKHEPGYTQEIPAVALPGRKHSSSTGDSISFTMNEVHGGFAEGQGVLQFEPNQLTFEWLVKDSLFGAIQSELKHLTLPTEQISKMRLKDYWLWSRLYISSRSLRSLDPLPQEKMGTVKLAVSRADRFLIQQWILNYGFQEHGHRFPQSSNIDRPWKPETQSPATSRVDWKIATIFGAFLVIPILLLVILSLFFITTGSVTEIKEVQPTGASSVEVNASP